ncbi:MAG: ribosome silencing factor [Bacteroidota bacterium]
MNTTTASARTTAAPSQQVLSPEDFNALIIDSIQDIKGINIMLLDLREIDDAPTHFFIICEGESNVQVKAIANNVNRRLKQEAHTQAVQVEGMETGKWVCLDYFTTVVHVFYPETRAFYELEQLWSDAKVTEYQNL